MGGAEVIGVLCFWHVCVLHLPYPFCTDPVPLVGLRCECVQGRRFCVLAARVCVCPPPPLSILRRPRPISWSALVLHNAATVVEKIFSPKESVALPRGHTFSRKVCKKISPPR